MYRPSLAGEAGADASQPPAVLGLRGRATSPGLGGPVPQSSSSPGGRNVKGRSASVMSVEAIQRVRASKTGVTVEGSSSCCSEKRTEPS